MLIVIRGPFQRRSLAPGGSTLTNRAPRLCHTGEGRYPSLKWIPAFAGKTRRAASVRFLPPRLGERRLLLNIGMRQKRAPESALLRLWATGEPGYFRADP